MNKQEFEQKIKDVLENSYMGVIRDGNYNFYVVRQAMIDFAFQMCEIQKQLCAENAKITTTYYQAIGRDSENRKDCEVDLQSILNSKNATTTEEVQNA